MRPWKLGYLVASRACGQFWTGPGSVTVATQSAGVVSWQVDRGLMHRGRTHSPVRWWTGRLRPVPRGLWPPAAWFRFIPVMTSSSQVQQGRGRTHKCLIMGRLRRPPLARATREVTSFREQRKRLDLRVDRAAGTTCGCRCALGPRAPFPLFPRRCPLLSAGGRNHSLRRQKSGWKVVLAPPWSSLHFSNPPSLSPSDLLIPLFFFPFEIEPSGS